MTHADSDPDADRPQERSLLLLVVGSTLLAEAIDRPAAYALREHINAWFADQGAELEPEERLVPVVCADLWFLNQPDLLHKPAIAIGAPSTNAAVAYFAGRLPTVLAIDGGLQVCMDPELLEPRACVWGSSNTREPSSTGEEGTPAA